jgi:hypothetical protein
MNVVELHPEELIDLEARGDLDEAAVARLEAHCARCVACRYERTMRPQFAGLREHVSDGERDARRGTPHVTTDALRNTAPRFFPGGTLYGVVASGEHPAWHSTRRS